MFYLYADFILTSLSFSWVPKHDNNAHMRIFFKEAPVSQGLVKGFRHYKTGPGQAGSSQKAAETTMSLQYVHTFQTIVNSLCVLRSILKLPPNVNANFDVRDAAA